MPVNKKNRSIHLGNNTSATRWWIGLVLGLVLGGISVSLYWLFTQADTASDEQGSTASFDWTLNNLKGQPITLSSYRGQPVLLVFWATWCPYCKKLLPGIQRLHEEYAEKGLKIIAVNIKEDWKPEVYWRNHEYTFDAVLEGDAIAARYGISGTPGLVFIDPNGKVLGVKQFSDPEHPLLRQFAEHYTR
jgi:thiol-disulfide isomerase/thioredoxin